MSLFHSKIASKQSSLEYQSVKTYCQSAEMELKKDTVSGFWLHYDGKMRFVRHLSEVRGLVDYLNA